MSGNTKPVQWLNQQEIGGFAFSHWYNNIYHNTWTARKKWIFSTTGAFLVITAPHWTRNATFGPKWTKMPIFNRIWPFWAKNPNFQGREQNFWNPHIGEPIRHLFYVKNNDRRGSNRQLGTKKCNFDPKNLIFGTKSQFVVLESWFFVRRAYHQYIRGYPEQIFQGSFSGDHPGFWPFSAVP